MRYASLLFLLLLAPEPVLSDSDAQNIYNSMRAVCLGAAVSDIGYRSECLRQVEEYERENRQGLQRQESLDLQRQQLDVQRQILEEQRLRSLGLYPIR